MKFWFVMRAYQDLQTDLKRKRETTGRHSRICVTKSSGNSLAINIGFLCCSVREESRNDSQSQGLGI
jgi:hypothetical protein